MSNNGFDIETVKQFQNWIFLVTEKKSLRDAFCYSRFCSVLSVTLDFFSIPTPQK
jgi:hypothetical protein